MWKYLSGLKFLRLYRLSIPLNNWHKNGEIWTMEEACFGLLLYHFFTCQNTAGKKAFFLASTPLKVVICLNQNKKITGLFHSIKYLICASSLNKKRLFCSTESIFP